MSSLLSRFALLIQEGKHEVVKRKIQEFPTLTSNSTSVSGRKSKVIGTVLHVSKSKKITYNKTMTDKRAKKETSYYRMVFCRENGMGGSVFIILFDQEQKVTFQLSNFYLGQGIAVISPFNEGEWNGSTVLRSESPCLEWNVELTSYVPVPFPETGFVAFAFKNVGIEVIDIGLTTTCPGSLCHGLYGTKCPCVSTSALQRTAVSICISFKEITYNLSEHHALKVEKFICTKLTNLFLEGDKLEQFVKLNDRENLHKFIDHVERTIEATKWDVLGWWKASSVDDAALCHPKGRIVSMTPTGVRVPCHFNENEVINEH